MSRREWKPGDVAIHEGTGEIAVRHAPVTTGHEWVWTGVSHSGQSFRAIDSFGPMRPLVVIDPGEKDDTDLVDVDRLDDLLWAHEYDHDKSYLERYTILSAALREFANPTPPKPEEPTGLGAVVEDADGERWVRSHTASEAQWTRPHLSGTYFYRQIAAVRVLSEGIS